MSIKIIDMAVAQRKIEQAFEAGIPASQRVVW